ncbi:phosphodiester glycosidase family protein, partial [Bacillus thuringiensis]|nr:phosphodiester glycosidase family protein [Bacillus thuringiensis]
MNRSTVRIKRLKKRVIKRIFILFLLGAGVLFGTSYGHQLRVEVAETILTTEHRYLAKYTFLSKEELDDLLNKINNPKWKDSNNIGWGKLSARQMEQRKKQPLHIEIQTIHSTETAEWIFIGKLITINNPFHVKLVAQQGTQGSEKGEKLSVIAKRNHALVAVNANGFSDETGRGGGATAIGI